MPAGMMGVERSPMSNVAIHRAGELPGPVRSVIEQLLGRSLAPDEEVSIVAKPPETVAADKDRAEAARKLEALLERRAGKVKDVSGEALDAAIDEALREVRRSRR